MEKRSDGNSRLARRRFLKAVPAAVAAGLAAPSLAQQAQEQRIRKEALDCAEKIPGIDFSDADQQQALSGVNNNLASFERLRNTSIPLDTEPPLTFRPYLPGRKPKPGATPNGKVKVTTPVPAARRSSPRAARSRSSRPTPPGISSSPGSGRDFGRSRAASTLAGRRWHPSSR